MDKKKILIVEDDKFFRDLVTQRLNKEGFDVIGVDDGKGAPEAVKSNNPALVILDLILPGIDGFEVLSQLKKDKETASVPVLILSNLGQKEEVEKGMSMGAEDFLVKINFTPEEITERVRKILQKKYL